MESALLLLKLTMFISICFVYIGLLYVRMNIVSFSSQLNITRFKTLNEINKAFNLLTTGIIIDTIIYIRPDNANYIVTTLFGVLLYIIFVFIPVCYDVITSIWIIQKLKRDN